MKKLLFGVSLLCVFMVSAPRVSAAVLADYAQIVNVTVGDNGQQQVSYELEGTQSAGSQEVAIALAGTKLDNLSLVVDGQTVSSPTTTAQTYASGPLTTHYTELKFQPKGSSWTAEISYQTTDLVANGALKTFSFPHIPLDADSVNEQFSVTFPLDYGVPVPLGLQATDSQVVNGTQTYEYEFDEAVRDKSIILEFSTEQTYDLVWEQTFTNSSWWWQTFEMVLAPDSNQQIIQLETITPQPASLRLDQDGNILARFRVSPRGDVVVKATATAQVRSVRYAVDPDRTVEEVPDTLDGYLQNDGLWSDGVAVGGESAAERVELLLKEATAEVSTQSAENYMNFINKLVADARASGIPARLISGRLTHNGVQAIEGGQQHYWAEAYIPGTGWMTVDPALNTRYDQFAVADAYHIAEFIRGVDSHKPKANAKAVTYHARTEPLEGAQDFTPSISQTKYILVPGVSFVKTHVMMPAGRVVDGLGYSSHGQTYRLGSLAPLQQISQWTVAVGSQSWSENEVAVGFLSTDGIEGVAVSDSKLSYVVVAAVVTLVGLALFIIRRLKHRKNRPIVIDEPDEDVQIPAEELLQRPNSEDL